MIILLAKSHIFLLVPIHWTSGPIVFGILNTPKGATVSAIVYTMVEMAKANGLNIYKYLSYLFAHRLSTAMTDEQLDQLAPWSKDVIDSCSNVK